MLYSVNVMSTMVNQANRLALETSPYLLQHSYNPVDWFPWGDEAFEVAKRDNKLLLISIGYSSCHWCHVMEKETFSDPAVAEVMNSKYVCIKVDREERPDIDQIYMNAVQIITRSGGWPLNCFALPDGRPIFGGTYFKKENWLNVLESLNTTWVDDRNRVIDVADELSKGVAETEIVKFRSPIEQKDKEVLTLYIEKLKRILDYKYGGTKGAPKFPMPGMLDFLLTFGFHFPDDEILNYVNTTLDKMAKGGIYDHIGGGFARYSTDENWHIPHFEKMLYDNAQLISVYSKAYRVNPDHVYKQIVFETINFIERELKSPNGGYYSSLDADSNGVEGHYYVWLKPEIEKVLGHHSELFCSAYGVTASGNWNCMNVLRRCATNKNLEEIFKITEDKIDQILKESIEKLYKERENRVRPGLDDKIIVSWNSLYISSLIEAYITFHDQQFLKLALDGLNYLWINHLSKGQLKRVACKGKVYVEAVLDDYVFFIKSFLDIYKITSKNDLLTNANKLIEIVYKDFYDEKSGMFFYTSSKSSELIVRKMDLTDGVMPSSNSVMANNLLRIGTYNVNENYINDCDQVTSNIYEYLNLGTPYVYNWAYQTLLKVMPNIMVTSSDDGRLNIHDIMTKTIYPKLFHKVNSESGTSKPLSVCIGNACSSNINNVSQIIEKINAIRLYPFN